MEVRHPGWWTGSDHANDLSWPILPVRGSGAAGQLSLMPTSTLPPLRSCEPLGLAQLQVTILDLAIWASAPVLLGAMPKQQGSESMLVVRPAPGDLPASLASG